MSMSSKMERRFVSHDEFEILLQTHHPVIHDLPPEALATTQQRLRDLRAKERTLARDMQRAIRGKGAQRGTSFPGNADKPARRKQVFAHALRRVNAELARRRARTNVQPGSVGNISQATKVAQAIGDTRG